ncbi:MAG: hypothetical protein KDC71_11140 [Acidobacteria bacterium]|nr:hypothetical protein [Acidobacteriota bacterium]
MKRMLMLLLLLSVLPLVGQEDECSHEGPYTAEFNIEACDFYNRYPTYSNPNPYFILEPGWQLVLEGEEDGEIVHLEITVLDEVEWVDGVWTRVIEEREWVDEELVEVSRNFFAACADTNDIYYFGEDVDNYEDGEIINHNSAWRSGVNNAKAGLYMPGTILLGARYYQEVAPGVALDRAEIMEVGEIEVGEWVFENAVFTQESTDLDDPCSVGEKVFAPGIGLVQDESLELVSAEFIFHLPDAVPFKR